MGSRVLAPGRFYSTATTTTPLNWFLMEERVVAGKGCSGMKMR